MGTSSLNHSVVAVICFFDNFDAGYAFLERHLRLPKAKRPIEFKWNKLNPKNRQRCYDNFSKLLNISCRGLLAINTNVLISPMGSPIYAFTNLIEGCCSGFETMPSQPMNVREGLRQKFFSFCNNTPIHCDADFRPLTTDKIVRSLVRTLSTTKGAVQAFTPLHVSLRSEESEPIQVADIIAGITSKKTRDFEKPPDPLSYLFFDARKINRRARKRGKFAKAYYWLINE